VSHCLNAGGMGRIDYESETFIPVTGGVFDVAHALRGEGFDASEDGTGRGTPLVPVVAGAICRDSFAGGAGGRPEGAAAGHFLPIAIQERAVSENPDAGPQGAGYSAEGCSYTLEARNKVQAVAFAQNQRGELRTSEISPQLTTGGGKPGEGYPAVAFDLRGREGGAMPEGPHDTANIRAADGGSSRSYVAQPWAVRRLTPRECERLQGFPDDFTKVPGASKGGWREVDETEDLDDLRAYGMPLRMKGNVWMVKDPDGPRYKALGNSWAVNVAEWVGERITEVDAW
jgi:DNA (cytosine-5)-methyltransferase 1